MVDRAIKYRDWLDRRFTTPRDRICAHFLNRLSAKSAGKQGAFGEVSGLNEKCSFPRS